MKITILRRYDINGASCDFDVEIGEFKPDANSMYKVHEVIDIDELKEKAKEYDSLTEEVKCYKCGHEQEASQRFCVECLQVMD